MYQRPGRDEFELPPSARRIGRAIDAEIAAHLDDRATDLMAAGMSRDDAYAQATREFGDVAAAKSDLLRIDTRAARTNRVVELATDLGTDVRRTFRGLIRRPAFTFLAVGTLALGIGANAVMYGLVDHLLLSPPPHISDAERVVRLGFNVRNRTGRITWVRGDYAAYETLATQRNVFDGATAYSDRSLTLATRGEAVELSVAAVAPNYFSFLGTRPAAGRLFRDTNDEHDDLSVVLSHRLWVQNFGGANMIGQPVRIGAVSYTVIGVAPPGFRGDGARNFDAWIKLGNTTPTLGARWRTSQVFVLARLRSDVTAARAVEHTSRVYQRWLADTPAPDSTARIELAGLIAGRSTADGRLTPLARVAVWLQAVSLLVLLIAIANVVNLLLVRAIERQVEIAVHLALGISRLRLLRHMTLENLILAATGGALAIFIARWAGPALWNIVIPGGIDAAAVAGTLATIAAGIATVCALLMTVIPAVVQRATSIDALRGSTRGTSRRGTMLGDALVVVQVAMTTVLLVGAGLFVRSTQRLANIDVGFETEKVIGARVTPELTADAAAREAMFTRIRQSLDGLPGVESISMGLSAPFRPSMNVSVFLPGRDALPNVGENGLGYPRYFAVSPEYLATMGIPLLRGRGFTNADRAGGARVMLIDATMARTFWPGEDAIGRCVRLVADTMPCTTVVGIVGDTRRFLVESSHTLWFYVPLEQSPTQVTDRYFFVRSSRATPEVANTVRAAIAAAAPSAPFVESFLMHRALDNYATQWRLGARAFTSFGVLATLIAAIGLFGVVSFRVARRRREFGIRRALGESRVSVFRRVLRDATMQSATGLAVGGVASVALSWRLHDLLYQPSTRDAVVFAGAATVVMLSTLAASVAPAVHATRVDPMAALRAE